MHCAQKIIFARQHAGSASAERVGQGEVGGVTRRVTYTWWLLGLTVKTPWLGPRGPILALAVWTGLEDATPTLQGVHFWQGRLSGQGNCESRNAGTRNGTRNGSKMQSAPEIRSTPR